MAADKSTVAISAISPVARLICLMDFSLVTLQYYLTVVKMRIQEGGIGCSKEHSKHATKWVSRKHGS